MSADTIGSALEQATTLPELVDACDADQREQLQNLVAAYFRMRIWALTPERKREIVNEITYGAAPPAGERGGGSHGQR